MSELLPCPFCPDGGEPVITPISGTTAIYGYRVWCRECLVEKNERTKEKAIAAWNTRAERTCHDIEARADYWQCSECGVQLENPIECPTLWDGRKATAPSFCPGCGARVAGD